MKKFKKLSALLLCLAMLVGSVALLTACGECEHEWGEWTPTGAATCSGTEEKRVCSECEEVETRNNGDASAHSFGAWSVKTAATCTANGIEERKCANCTVAEQRTVTATGHNGVIICETCFEQLVAGPVVDTTEWNSVGFLLKDMTVEIVDEEYPEESGTATVDLAEFYVALDEDGALTGYGHGVINSVGAAVDGPNNQMAVYAYIENDKIYLCYEGAAPLENSNEVEKSYMVVDLANVPELEEIRGALAQAEGYYAMVEAMMPELEAWYEEKLAPVFSEVTFEYNDARLKALTAKVINSLFVATATDNGTTYTLSLEVLKEWNQTLSEKKISEIIDLIAGDGVYAEIKETVNSDTFYNYNVGALLDYIQTTKGVDLAALLDALDALVAIVMDDETATLESALAMSGAELPEGFDLGALLTDEDFRAFSVKDALLMLANSDMPEDADAITLDEIKTEIAEVFTTLEETTAYELIALMIGGDMNGSVDNNPELMSATEETDPTAAMVEMINGYIDTIGETITVAVNYDKAGAFVNTVITVNLPEEYAEGAITITVTTEKIVADIAVDSDSNEYDMTVEIVPGYTATPDAAKLAEIKAQLAKAPEITQDIAYEALRKDYPSTNYGSKVEKLDDGSVRVVGYAYDNDVIPAETEGYSVYSISYYVYLVDSYVCPILSIAKGCQNLIYVEYTLAKGYDYITVDTTLQNGLTWDEVIATPEYAEALASALANATYSVEDLYIELLYDTVTEQITYYGYDSDLGHTYDDGTVVREAVGCDDIGKIEYKCTKCNETYCEWYVNGHDIKTISTVDGNVYSISIDCVREGCDYVADERGTLTFANTAEATVDNTPDYTEYYWDDDANVVFAFEYAATQDGKMSLFYADMGGINRIVVDIYRKATAETEYERWMDRNVYADGNDYGTDLEAGYTYYFVVFVEHAIYKTEINATLEAAFNGKE